MFEKNIPTLIKETKEELLLKKYLLAIIRTQSKGFYSEDEVKEQLKKTLIVFDISAFCAGITKLRREKIFEVHAKVSDKRDKKRLELESSVNALTYRLALLNKLSDEVTVFDEYLVLDAMQDFEELDITLLRIAIEELQRESIIFPVNVPLCAE